MTNAEGSTARALHVPHGRKSDQFSLEPNRKHFPSQDAPWLSPVAPSVPHGSQFVVFSSMFEKSPKKGICFEFMLWILNEFLPCACCAVFLQRGVLPDFDSNFLWMMVDWVFPFPRLVLAEQEPHEEAKTGRQSVVRRRCEGVRNNFSHAPDYAWTSFQKMGVRKLKICKFSLVSKICCFFGSLSCVFDSRWFDVWNAV